MHRRGLRIPRLTVTESFTEFLSGAAGLSAPQKRPEAAAKFAAALGGIDLIIFIRDPEIETFVVAPGFRNPIPAGKVWRDFLAECVKKGEHSAQLPFQKVDNVQTVLGIAPTGDAVLVLVGLRSTDQSEWLCGVLPLLSAMLRGEQAGKVAAASARLAGDAVARTEAMTEVLEQSRAQLQEALIAAESSRKAALEATRIKSEFLATMSHELRTPLNAIGGYTQLLAMGIHGKVTKEQLDTLNRIDRSQRHLLGLINEILNLSRLEAGKLDYNIGDVDVAEIVGDIAPMIEPQLDAKGILRDVQVPEGICVRADRDKLQQILLNLLSNAVKFTQQGGRIDVTAGVSVEEKVAWISVADTGLGIPADKMEAIFEPFIQVDSRHSRPEQGAGLGLSISRDLARGMMGEITVTSKLGSGSTFIVTLPASA